MMFVLVFLLLQLTHGRIYDRCELARELRYIHKAPPHQLATWVCIAEHESQYNTSIVGYLSGDGSGDHGIFQISDKFWCSPPNKGYACGVTCAELEDDDISDDFICAQRIYKEHKLLSGDGFNAWAVYQPHCKGPKADRYIKDCFDVPEEPKTLTTPTPVFAHGFFDTKTTKGFTIPTRQQSFEPFLSFRSPSVAQRNDLTFATQKPQFSTTPKPLFVSNRFFTSTETPTFDLFFTPTTSSSFKPSSTSVFTPTSSVVVFNPTTSVFGFGNTFSSPSSRLFTPTVSTPTSYQFQSSTVSPPTSYQYQSSTVSSQSPVFIFNGVKWY